MLSQLDSFKPTQHENLLFQLRILLESKHKKRKDESITYSEIEISQIEEIVKVLCKIQLLF